MLRWLAIGFVLAPFVMATLALRPQKLVGGRTPRSVGLPYEEITLLSQGRRLSAWYLPGFDSQAASVVLVHGLAANKQNILLPALQLSASGHSVLMFDLPAHGASEGELTTLGFAEAEDVRAAWMYLRARRPQPPIVAMGYSMGGAAVARAQQQYQLFDALVLDSTFSSVHSIAEHRYLWLYGPLGGAVWSQLVFWAQGWTGCDMNENAPDGYEQVDAAPVLLIHGLQDSVIPPGESIRLKSVWPHADLWLVPQANHMQTITRRSTARESSSSFRPRRAAERDGAASGEARRATPSRIRVGFPCRCGRFPGSPCTSPIGIK